MYARIENGSIVEYPYSLNALRAAHPRTSFPSEIPAATLAEFGVVEVVRVSSPNHDGLTQTVEEAPPVFAGGHWKQAFTLRSASDQELADRAETIRLALTQAVQDHIDAEAQSHHYDGILSLASYATSTNPPFSAEGRAGADWRDAVWLHCFAVLADVKAGERAIPTAAELIAELPVMVWPVV